MLVAARHQLKDEHRAGVTHWEMPDLVDDEERGMREDLQARLQPTRSLRFFERGDEIRQGAVVHATPGRPTFLERIRPRPGRSRERRSAQLVFASLEVKTN